MLFKTQFIPENTTPALKDDTHLGAVLLNFLKEIVILKVKMVIWKMVSDYF